MSYSFYFKLQAHRFEKSKEAYEKFKAKNPGLTPEELETEVNKLRGKFSAQKQPGLYWWAIKVINGWTLETSNGKKYIWG